MMNRILIILCISFLLISPSFAQKNKVSPENFALAEKMKAEYEDQGVVATNSKIDITFDFDNKTKNVSVTVTKDEEFISLKPGYEHPVVEFFNEQSKVKMAEAFNEKNKKFSIFPGQRDHSSDDIFYSDAQIYFFNLEFPTIGTRRRTKMAKTYFDVRYFVSEYLTDYYPCLLYTSPSPRDS